MHTPDVLHRLCCSLLTNLNVPPADAKVIADVLISAEMRGIPSHGLLRLPDYLRMLSNGRMNARPEIKKVHESPSTLLIDADNAPGMVAAVFAMNQAIEKARQAGTGWVAVRNSNHYGIAGYYAMMALEHDMIGICMTNANPLVAPTFSTSRYLGTNPLAVAIPAGKEPPLVADFATSAIARGKLDVMEKKGMKISHGFVQDAQGIPSDNPGILASGGAILPLGGSREHGSHKGYCLASVVDVLSAVLSGANYGPFVPPSVAYLELAKDLPGKGTGHFFGAMRIDAFQSSDDFKQQMDNWLRLFRNAQPAGDFTEVLVPGDPERKAEQYHKKHGIELLPAVMQSLREWCNIFTVNCPF